MPSVGLYFGVYSYCKRTIGPMFRQCLGSERDDGKKPFFSDSTLHTCSIAMSAAIGTSLKYLFEREMRLFCITLVLFCLNNGINGFFVVIFVSAGNTVASFSRVPYEVVKQALQTGQFSSTTQALGTMWKDGGVRSFFPLGGVSIQMVSQLAMI